MCTVIIARKLFERHPVIIAANRDEMLDRPSSPPAVWEDGPRLLAPQDLQRGGTWIGVNARGVAAAVTNRNDVVSMRGKDSRGELALMALESATAEAAVERVLRLDTHRYNGFHLVIADAEAAYVLYGDGERAAREQARVETLPEGLSVVSNLGVGPDHAPRAEAVMRAWQAKRLARHRPHRATWDALLTIHDPSPNADPSWMKRMASTCIHRPAEDGYGTKSSAFILLDGALGAYGPEWRWWHRERDGGHNCAARWGREMKLPIVGP